MIILVIMMIITIAKMMYKGCGCARTCVVAFVCNIDLSCNVRCNYCSAYVATSNALIMSMTSNLEQILHCGTVVWTE